MKYYYEDTDITNYKGKNLIIKQIQSKRMDNSSYQLTDFEEEYLSTNLTFKEIGIDKFINFLNEDAPFIKYDEKQLDKDKSSQQTDLILKYGLNTNGVFIQSIQGETNGHIHIVGSHEKGEQLKHMLIPHCLLETHPTKDYSDITLKLSHKHKLDYQPYDFQLTGVKHLLKYKKCFLCDDKGLGKTFQSILAALEHGKKTLVVTIKATKQNWFEEIGYLTNKVALIKDGKTYPTTLRSDFVVMNYHLLVKHIDKLLLEDFKCIILDECQTVTSPSSNMTKALNKLVEISKPEYVWNLSATPIQRIQDFIPLLKFIGSDEVYSFNEVDKFKKFYLEIEEFKKIRNLNIPTSLITFSDIKKFNINSIKLELKSSGRYIVKKGGINSIGSLLSKVFWNYLDRKIVKDEKGKYVDNFNYFIDVKEGWVENSFTYPKNSTAYEKVKYINNFFWSDYLTNDKARKCIIDFHFVQNNVKETITLDFSWYTIENIKKVNRDDLFRQKYMKHLLLSRTIDDNEVDKEIPPIRFHKIEIELTNEQQKEYDDICLDSQLVEQLRHLQYLANVKVPHTIKLIEKVIKKDEKFIIGCTFDEELKLFKEHYGDKIHLINGATTDKKRQKYCKELKDNNDIIGIVGNIDAMGTGLNMIGANKCVQNSGHYNPNKADQLSGRIRRIGQTKDCDYYSTIVQGTQDDHVQKVNTKKLKLIDFMLRHNWRH